MNKCEQIGQLSKIKKMLIKNCKYNLGKKRKVSIVFADMIADILSNGRKF